MNLQVKKRDDAVELFRVSLMFGIVLLHTMTFSSYESPDWLWRILHSSVNGFMIISGWYGIRFAPSKILCLLGVLLYAMLFEFIGLWIMDDLSMDRLYSFIEFYKKNPWFLYAYIFVMLFAPLMNVIFEMFERKRLIYVFAPFFLLLLWSAVADMPKLGRVFPTTSGIGSYTGLTLLGCYVIGRLARLFQFDVKVGSRKIFWGMFIVLCGLIIVSRMGYYASPFAMLLGLTVFLIFKRLSISNGLARLVGFIAPSMFSVYLLHNNRVVCFTGGGINLLQKFLVEDCGITGYSMFLFSAILIFMLAIVFDIPRRVICKLLARQMNAFKVFIDSRYDRLLFHGSSLI